MARTFAPFWPRMSNACAVCARRPGDAAEIYVDANCSLDPSSAQWLAGRIRAYEVSFFEEPLRDNDCQAMRAFRQQTGMRVAAGQNEGQLWRFEQVARRRGGRRHSAQCGDIAAASPRRRKSRPSPKREMLNSRMAAPSPSTTCICTQAWPNGGLVEWHLISVEMCRALFNGLPDRNSATLKLPETPGLGFATNPDALRDFAARATSSGRGKG